MVAIYVDRCCVGQHPCAQRQRHCSECNLRCGGDFGLCEYVVSRKSSTRCPAITRHKRPGNDGRAHRIFLGNYGYWRRYYWSAAAHGMQLFPASCCGNSLGIWLAHRITRFNSNAVCAYTFRRTCGHDRHGQFAGFSLYRATHRVARARRYMDRLQTGFGDAKTRICDFPIDQRWPYVDAGFRILIMSDGHCISATLIAPAAVISVTGYCVVHY